MKKLEFLQRIATELSACGMGSDLEVIEQQPIGHPRDVTRPVLLEVIHEAEDLSGKRLFSPQFITPLKYFRTDLTIGEIAEYFDQGNRRVEEVFEKADRLGTDGEEIKVFNLRGHLAKNYCKYAGKKSENFKYELVKDCSLALWPDLKDWVSPLVYLEDEANAYLCPSEPKQVFKPGFFESIGEGTDVYSILSLFVAVYM